MLKGYNVTLFNVMQEQKMRNTAVWAVLFLAGVVGANQDKAIVLDSNAIRIEVDRVSGAITSFLIKKTKLRNDRGKEALC